MMYKYGMKEAESTKAYIYFFSSSPLLILNVFLIYKQSKTDGGIAIAAYLKNALLPAQIVRFDKSFFAIILYSLITFPTYAVVYFYEKSHPTQIVGDPNQWTFSLTHFIWQYIYIIPLTFMFWYIGLRKFTKTIIICSLVYPFVLLAYLLIYAFLVNH